MEVPVAAVMISRRPRTISGDYFRAHGAMTVSKRPRVVIVGAGFGGLRAVRALARSPAEVLLIDRNNYHTFNPMLYQVAAAELEPEQIAYPVRSILRKLPNADFVIAEVKRIDLANQIVETDGTRIPYDFLILATGSITQFLKIPGAAEYAFPLDNLQQAVALRNQVLGCFEQAVYELDAERRQRLLTFPIVGGGPTGVEFAGALVELIHGSLRKDYPTLDFREVRVLLLQSGNSLLAGMPKRLQLYTLAHLRKMGVEIYLEARARQVTSEAVHLHDGKVIPTETVVWAVGVHADPQVQKWGLPTAGKGQLAVLPTLQVPEYPQVYVIGDLASVEKGDGRPLPMVAPAAIQQGLAAAQNIQRQLVGRHPVSFHYSNKGTVTIIGRNAAAAHVGKLTFTGFLAWILWIGVHLLYLTGFRNRLLVLINWIWDYFFHARGVRLILRPRSKGRIFMVQKD